MKAILKQGAGLFGRSRLPVSFLAACLFLTAFLSGCQSYGPEEQYAVKTTESFLKAMKSGESWPYSVENDPLNLLAFESQTSGAPESFLSTYREAVFENWYIENAYLQDDKIKVIVTLSTLDPQAWSLSALMESLQPDLEEKARELKEGASLDQASYQETFAAMSSQLKDYAYEQLSSYIQQLPSVSVELTFTFDQATGEIETIA